MASLDHILLYCLFFIVLFIFSSKSNKRKTPINFWNSAIITILLFIIIEGCRYGRGADYLSYKYRFEHIDIFEPQKLYLFINQLLNFVGADYVGAFMAYSLVFIVGTFYFIRKSFEKKEAKWMYFFAIISMLFRFESFPKQYLGLPFILCAIPNLFNEKWLKAIVFVVIGLNIHSGLTFFVVAIVGAYFMLKKTLSAKVWLILLFIVYYILPTGYLADFFTSILQSLNLGSILMSDHITSYVENADRWLGTDSIIESSKQSFLTKTLQFLFESSIIILSSLSLSIKNNQKILAFHNITLIGFIFFRMFHGFEIFARLFGQLYIFWFILLGYALYVYSSCHLKKNSKLIMKISLFYAFVYQTMLYIRFIFLNPEATYVWNL